jgi:hypothetical protein
MTIASLASGFGAASRHLRVAVLFWLSTLMLALPATFAFAAWWWDAIAYAPPAHPVDLGTLIDMVEYNEVGVWGLLFAGLGGTVAIALAANALLAGGALEVLVDDRRHRDTGTTPDDRRFLHRFFRGAGHFFLRSLALLVAALVVAALVVAAVAAGIGAAIRPLEDSMSAALAWTHLLAPIAIVGVLVVFFCGVVLDLARIDLVRHGRRNALVAYWRGLTLAVQRWWTTLWIWVIAGVVGALFVFGYARIGGAVSAFVPGFLLLQVLVFALAWLRVSVLAAELEVSVRTRPDATPASLALPPPDAAELPLRAPEAAPEPDTARPADVSPASSEPAQPVQPAGAGDPVPAERPSPSGQDPR